MFQFSETPSLKLIFSSLVMLFTMDDRRRRLEDAEDSLVSGKTKEIDLQHRLAAGFVFFMYLSLIVSEV